MIPITTNYTPTSCVCTLRLSQNTCLVRFASDQCLGQPHTTSDEPVLVDSGDDSNDCNGLLPEPPPGLASRVCVSIQPHMVLSGSMLSNAGPCLHVALAIGDSAALLSRVCCCIIGVDILRNRMNGWLITLRVFYCSSDRLAWSRPIATHPRRITLAVQFAGLPCMVLTTRQSTGTCMDTEG